MRKLIFFLFLSVLSFVSVAQNVKFMGQPLGCKYSVMKQHLLNNGFKNIYNFPGCHTFDGIFGGEEVTLSVYVTYKSNLVSSIVVNFPTYTANKKNNKDFTRLMRKRKELEDDFIEKYGPPAYADAPPGDNNYLTVWHNDNMTIDIMVSNTLYEDYDVHCLLIGYVDIPTSLKREEEKRQDY